MDALENITFFTKVFGVLQIFLLNSKEIVFFLFYSTIIATTRRSKI
jgi:hypothetical protein